MGRQHSPWSRLSASWKPRLGGIPGGEHRSFSAHSGVTQPRGDPEVQPVSATKVRTCCSSLRRAAMASWTQQPAFGIPTPPSEGEPCCHI